jgi:hypothetical protein
LVSLRIHWTNVEVLVEKVFKKSTKEFSGRNSKYYGGFPKEKL